MRRLLFNLQRFHRSAVMMNTMVTISRRGPWSYDAAPDANLHERHCCGLQPKLNKSPQREERRQPAGGGTTKGKVSERSSAWAPVQLCFFSFFFFVCVWPPFGGLRAVVSLWPFTSPAVSSAGCRALHSGDDHAFTSVTFSEKERRKL